MGSPCCSLQKTMDAERMHALACEYQKNKSEDSLNNAILESLPLCQIISKRFAKQGVDYEDLYQVASMALVQALKSFDPQRGLRFSTFVTPTITGTVRNYIRDKGSVLRTPRGLKEQSVLLKRVRDELTNTLRREPTVREIADHLSWPMPRVLDTLSSIENSNISSLDTPLADGRMPAETMGILDDGYLSFENKNDLKDAFKLLSNDEKLVLSLRYFKNKTQKEIAEKLNMSQMQVSRMERRALLTLKKEMNGDV